MGGYFGGRIAELPDGSLIVAHAGVMQDDHVRQSASLAFTVVRRWPRSLPQYGVGHLERMAELEERVHALDGLSLLGNGYRGVGLPDLIRDARAAARREMERS